MSYHKADSLLRDNNFYLQMYNIFTIYTCSSLYL